MSERKEVNLGDILPPEAMRPLANEITKIKRGQVKGSIKQHLAAHLAPHKEYMASKGADLDYICYYLEYAINEKLM
jgi:hypothetical protein